MGAGAATTVALGGVVGYGAGRGVQEAKGGYERVAEPIAKAGEKIDYVQDSKWNPANWFKDPDQIKREREKRKQDKEEIKAEEEKRKGLLHKYFVSWWRNPVETGIATGTGSALLYQGLHTPRYIRRIKRIKRRAGEIDKEERLGTLEERFEKLNELVGEMRSTYEDLKGYAPTRAELQQYQKQLAYFKEAIPEMQRKIEGLESRLAENPLKRGLVTIIGTIGLITSIILTGSVLTGFSIFEKDSYNSFLLPGIIFIVSLILIFLGLKGKSKKSRRLIKKK